MPTVVWTEVMAVELAQQNNQNKKHFTDAIPGLDARTDDSNSVRILCKNSQFFTLPAG